MNGEFEKAVAIYATKCLYNSTLKVAPTSLPGCSFFGLYAIRPFCKGQVVCKYVGDRYRTAEAIRLKDKSYLMRLGEQSYVDAQPHMDVMARYINDCINPNGWNVEFQKIPEKGYALVVATRDINCGEEIFVSYGKRYWMLQRPVKISDQDLVALQRRVEGKSCTMVSKIENEKPGNLS